MNRKGKGQRTQRELVLKLESDGWKVAVVERGGKFVKEKDMFGLFDLVAIKGKTSQFIQVTCNRPHTHRDYNEFAEKHAAPNRKIVQYVKYDRKGFKRFEYPR